MPMKPCGRGGVQATMHPRPFCALALGLPPDLVRLGPGRGHDLAVLFEGRPEVARQRPDVNVQPLALGLVHQVHADHDLVGDFHNLKGQVQVALERRGITDAFEIQAATVADALDGRDVGRCGSLPAAAGRVGFRSGAADHAEVDDVAILNVAGEGTSPRNGFAYRCGWTAAGSVGHWGHIHRRANQYNAVVTVEPVEGVWKITAIDLREEQRIDPTATK